MVGTVHQQIADELARQGIDCAFTVLGEGNLWILDSMRRRHGTQVVPAWHENQAVAMADAYARASGGLGLAAVTLGPGLTSCITSLTIAARHRTPMVVLVGAPPIDGSYHNQAMAQQSLILATGCLEVAVRHPTDVTDAVREAVRVALRRRLPVVLSVPLDVQVAMAPESISSSGGPAGTSLPHPSRAAVLGLHTQLVNARRSLLVVGAGALGADCAALIAKVADRYDCLIGTTVRALGALADHPHQIGLIGGFSTKAVREVLVGCDMVVGLGARLGHFTTEDGELFEQAHVTRVDLEPMARDYRSGRYEVLVADVALLLSDLLALQEPMAAKPGYAADLAAGQLVLTDLEGCGCVGTCAGVDIRAAVRDLDATLNSNSRLVVGVGHFWSFVVTETRRLTPGHLVLEDDLSAIGQGLAMGFGVSQARPQDQVFIVEGDGSLQFNPNVLANIGSSGRPICVLVMNDAAYAAEVHALRSAGVEDDLARHEFFDFAALARSYGLTGTRCSTRADLRAALAEFQRVQRPTLIDVRVCPAVVSAMYRRTRYGEDC